MTTPTQEQIERAGKIDAAVSEILALDTRDYGRADHIGHARELLCLRDQGVVLTYEVVGNDDAVPKGNLLLETIQSSIDLHLRLAEALRA